MTYLVLEQTLFVDKVVKDSLKRLFCAIFKILHDSLIDFIIVTRNLFFRFFVTMILQKRFFLFIAFYCNFCVFFFFFCFPFLRYSFLSVF